MIKKSSSVRKHTAKQRKQTSLDCFMQQLSKPGSQHSRQIPQLEELCLSQLSRQSSRDEFPALTPQCAMFDLGWEPNPTNTENHALKVMPPTPAPPQSRRKSKLELLEAESLEDGPPCSQQRSPVPMMQMPSCTQDAEGMSQELRPRALLELGSTNAAAANRQAHRQGERCIEAALAQGSLISPEPGAHSKPAAILRKRIRQDSTQGGRRPEVPYLQSLFAEPLRCGRQVKASKVSSRPSRVEPVKRNPFIPEASAAELMRSMMVPREVKTGSRFRNDYDEVKTIARNSNCEVCQCRKRFDGSLYAVKKLVVHSPTALAKARMEVFALAALSHQNVLRYYDSWHEAGPPGHLFIVTELCVRPLSRSLGLINAPPMCERVVRAMLQQLLQGLDHVHAAQMVHLDLKPANVFLSFREPALATEPNDLELLPHGEVILKLGDFGLAALLDNSQSSDGRYVCPSLMNERCSDLRLADLYSLAATIYAVALGNKLPDETSFRQAIRQGGGCKDSHLSTSVEAIIRSMLASRAEKRPSLSQVQNQLQEAFEEENHPLGYTVTISDFDHNGPITCSPIQ